MTLTFIMTGQIRTHRNRSGREVGDGIYVDMVFILFSKLRL